jgi:hypothetical protein
MATIEKYGAPGVYDPPGYSQAMKVTGARTLLFTAGQVPYDAEGGVKHRGDFKAQARAVFGAIKALVEAGGGTLERREDHDLRHGRALSPGFPRRARRVLRRAGARVDDGGGQLALASGLSHRGRSDRGHLRGHA